MLDVKGKEVVVLGFGVSGKAAADLLNARGAHVRVSESSPSADVAEELETCVRGRFPYETGAHTRGFCRGADMVVASPGVDVASLVREDIIGGTADIIGELELGYRCCPAPIIAVTGTNGKSTTTGLIGHMLCRNGFDAVVCGNIGNPLCGELGKVTENSVVVAEVSSFQIETIKEFRPVIAVLLNLSEDHYDRHGNFDGYRRSKFKIFRNQLAEDHAVVCRDLEEDPLSGRIRAVKHFFGPGETFRSDGNNVEFLVPGHSSVRVPLSDIPVKGEHNLSNISCAIFVAALKGVDPSHAARSLLSYKGLEHRFESVDVVEGVEFIDDSKATNVDAARAALNSLGQVGVVLIAGGRDKGGDYSPLIPLVRDKVRGIVAIGEARQLIKNAFSGIVPVADARDMEEAVDISFTLASRGDKVLLSPMCSSFDMFRDYKERGRVFRQTVAALAARRAAKEEVKGA